MPEVSERPSGPRRPRGLGGRTSSTSASASRRIVGEFDGRVVIVTGAASFIGEAIGSSLIDGGGSRRSSPIATPSTARPSRNGWVRLRGSSQTDVASDADLDRLIATAIDGFGRLDGVVGGERRLRGRAPGQRPRDVAARARRECRVGGDADHEGRGRDAAGRGDRPHRIGQRPRIAAACGSSTTSRRPALLMLVKSAGPPPRAARHPGQRRLARLDVEPQHRAALRDARTRRCPRRGVPAARPDGGAATRSPTPWRSCCRTARRSSPAPSCSSTAATRRSARGARPAVREGPDDR